ncbi:hypothetical protein K2173_016910 [Erythroxylum novogranatense]|uniref:Fungal lipase-type domain-containing protein n=1 Tax=Erythroxylum novogranatense TaxID=1862640 RepID=A0AAV8U8Q7_9ROSI|nr:hypothetical protein K2173_016910 [Erythroxylum novogranatense]
MLQISSALPPQNLNLFQAGRNSFKCKQSSPLIRCSSSSLLTSQSVKPVSYELNKQHLANLEKLLPKKSLEPNQADSLPVGPVPKVSGNGSWVNRGRALLEGLNVPRVWPERKAAEEMSPRHMNRLQRLLSKTPEYSPRNNLGSRWREYHGCNDWLGLLDPLDENLRRELVRYGEFVQAAYHSFHSNPALSAEEPPLPHPVALPDRSYKVTKSLYATSSVGLPKWVDDFAPDLSWMTQRSSWMGYVAVCDDRHEIQRMGRRDIVIALRGTSTCLEWAENMRAQLVEYPQDCCDKETEPDQGQSKVECGFLSLYKTRGVQVPSLAESVEEEVKRLVELYKGEPLSITVTGHSLGAALAILVGDELSTCSPSMPPIAVFSFGGPRVGNRGFANQINENNNVKVLRIVNNQDVITRVPGLPMMEGFDDNITPLAYTHVGTELLVDSKMSPYLKPNADVACCHDLEAYLHLVDGYLASNCPFRANAKRSLLKLVNEQRSNVKQLYTNKAKALSLNLERQGLANSCCLPSPS